MCQCCKNTIWIVCHGVKLACITGFDCFSPFRWWGQCGLWLWHRHNSSILFEHLLLCGIHCIQSWRNLKSPGHAGKQIDQHVSRWFWSPLKNKSWCGLKYVMCKHISDCNYIKIHTRCAIFDFARFEVIHFDELAAFWESFSSNYCWKWNITWFRLKTKSPYVWNLGPGVSIKASPQIPGSPVWDLHHSKKFVKLGVLML